MVIETRIICKKYTKIQKTICKLVIIDNEYVTGV